MMIHEITALVGKHRRRKRIGRGTGSGTGGTSGRGHKGAHSRAGWGGSTPPGYEGGQMPYFRRVPKRGFSNAQFTTRYAIVNTGALDKRFDDGADVTAERLIEVGLIRNMRLPIKILGQGDLSKKLTVTAVKFSDSARQKIQQAGGSCTVVEKVSAGKEG